MVLAGPGSGKTYTIVNRIQYLITEYKVRPEEILVITFTKKAALEMQERFLKMFPVQHRSHLDFRPVRFGTFHSIYYHILRWAYRFTDQNILKDSEKYHILGNLCANINADILDEQAYLSDLSAELGICKNNMIPIEEHIPTTIQPSHFRQIATQFEQTRKQLRKVDFDDMLVLCHDLLSSRPEALEHWSSKFSHILVDEFQDINLVQYKVLQLLASKHKNLFVVGDDDQAIYGFRGADSKLMFQFERDYSCKRILLNQNFRSTQKIIHQASRMISNNALRYDKKITSENALGTTIHTESCANVFEEGNYLISEINSSLQQGIPLSQMAILYRVHTEAKSVIAAMVRAKIPFVMKEALPNPFEHRIVGDVLSYFRLAMGMLDRADVLRVMNKPTRYLSRDAISASVDYNHSNKRIFRVNFEGLRCFYEEQEWMLDRVDEFEWQLKMMRQMAPYAALQFLLNRVGYKQYLADETQSSGTSMSEFLEIISFLEESMQSFDSILHWMNYVHEYQAELKKDTREKHTSEEQVALMTIHSSKGLEFERVFIIGANEGMIPYKRSVEKSLEEERRLFYVALTRAKSQVTITWVKEKNGKALTPSRFLLEL